MNEEKTATTYKEYKNGSEQVAGLGRLGCYKALDYLNKLLKKDIYYSEELEDSVVFIESYINRIEKENLKYKEEKRLILKDIKEWISCAKNEKLEGDYTHKQYWDMFETILRKTFNKYNTENLTDDDLKYNHYLEKENNELILENQKYKARWENLKNWIKSLPINEDNFDIILECIYNEYGKIGITKKAILEKMIDLEEE